MFDVRPRAYPNEELLLKVPHLGRPQPFSQTLGYAGKACYFPVRNTQAYYKKVL
jgi:hypothetical protein